MASFSERNGYVKVSEVFITEQMPIEVANSICNAMMKAFEKIELEFLDMSLWESFFNKMNNDYQRCGELGESNLYMFKYLVDESEAWNTKLDMLEKIIKLVRYSPLCPKSFVENFIRPKVYPSPDSEAYKWTYGDDVYPEPDDEYFIEQEWFIKRLNDDFIKELNSQFERLNFDYMIMDDLVVPRISEVETQEIEKALETPDERIRRHLKKALSCLAQIPVCDSENSIKESISAVEVCCKDITGTPKATLGDALNKLEKLGLLLLPDILKEALKKLYAYTNDNGTGIRHGLMGKPGEYTPSSAEAIYMLVVCSAVINYLQSKRIKK